MENILSEENFDEELTATDKFVIVDFYATWCGPCAVLGPIIEKIAGELKEKVVLFKIDVDNFPNTSQKYNIEKIPTVHLFKNGKSINNFVGLMSEALIKEWIENSIKDYK